MTFQDYTKDFLLDNGVTDLWYGYKQVAYGYDGEWSWNDGEIPIKYVRKKVVTFSIDGHKGSLDFLNYLPSKFVVQIGNTFYRKSGANFVYEYLNQSNDYSHNLDIEKQIEISIMYGGGLLG